MSSKSYIVKKINELPTFTGALSPDDLVAFYDISTGITHKIKVSEIGGGSLDHRDLTQESRFANDQHVMGSVVGLVDKIADLDSEDINLQHQIFQIIENSPIDIVRFFTRTQTTLSGQTVYLSSETKGTNAAFNITQAVIGTDRATANVIAKFAGDTPLTVERELPAQNTSLFLRLNKNNTQRNVFVFVEFYDYDEGSVLTLKGTTSDFEIRSDVDVYNVLLQIEAYIAQIGARSWIEIKSYQTGVGVAAQTTLGIEGDYYSRFQYRIPAGSLSFLDDKVISSQDLPNIEVLAGETQKSINEKIDTFLGGTLNTSEIDDTGWLTSEQRLAVLEKTLSGIQIKGAALLLDIFAPPGVEASLRDNVGWANETKTLTGDNSVGQIGQKGAHIWLNDAVYAECVSSVLAVSGSATYKRNRAVDVLDPVNNTQDAAIANQLDPSYTYPAMAPTGNSTDQGWNLTSQVKVITNLPTRWGMWFIGGINGDGYTYFCFLVSGNTSYWKRNGTPSSIQRPIYAATHPTLTGRLLAHNFTTDAYVTQAGDEVSYADQTFYDATTRAYFIKMINGNWEKIR